MFAKRSGLIVWLHDLKSVKQLDRHGTVHYISRKMNYAVVYVYTSHIDQTIQLLQKLRFVKKVERSFRDEIPTEYDRNNRIGESSKFYTL